MGFKLKTIKERYVMVSNNIHKIVEGYHYMAELNGVAHLYAYAEEVYYDLGVIQNAFDNLEIEGE